MAMIEKPMATAVRDTAIPTPTASNNGRRITSYGTPVVRRLLLSVVLLAAACGAGDDEPSRAEQARRLARDAGLGEEVADWLALAAGHPEASYRVAYGELVITQEGGERRVEAGDGVQGAVAADPGPFDEAAVER